MGNYDVKLAAALIAQKARFHLERIEPGSNLALGLAEIARIAERICAEDPPSIIDQLRKSAEGWTNAIELGLLPPQHNATARILRDDAIAAIARAIGEQP